MAVIGKIIIISFYLFVFLFAYIEWISNGKDVVGKIIVGVFAVYCLLIFISLISNNDRESGGDPPNDPRGGPGMGVL